MKNNNIPSTPLLIGILLFLIAGCAPGEPRERDNRFIDDYPEVGAAVEQRDFQSLLELSSHSDSDLAEYVWRSLAKTELDNSGELFDAVVQDGSYPAWYALSFHDLIDEDLQTLREMFRTGEADQSGLCTVFRRQGGGEELQLLLDEIEIPGGNSICATSAGFLMTRIEIGDEDRRTVFRVAFEAEEKDTRKGLLYGFFRSGLNRPEPGSDLAGELLDLWNGMDLHDTETDRMMVRIAGVPAAEEVLSRYSDRELRTEVQLAVELAASAQYLERVDLEQELIQRLLHHQNPHVQIRLLEALRQHGNPSDELLTQIREEIAGPTRNHELYFTSLELLLDHQEEAGWYRRKLDLATSQSPYLTEHSLRIYQRIESEEDFLNRIEDHLEEGGVRGLHATRALTTLWMEHEEPDQVRDRIHTIIMNSIERGDRSVISGLNSLLIDDKLVGDDDYELLYNRYSDFQERGERENSMNLEQVLEDRFPDRFEPVAEIGEKPFRTPDWDRLYEMGSRPYWILETNRGTVEVRLDPYSAPFTVSSIDSLTRAGAYDGVAFHRVVRNFVVQGGDFDRRDGFGGPDYRLPTEPSFNSYERGAVGVASSGTDTEGAQFFFMHQWAPHLDGDYTLFGDVSRGMDVVDRIQVGDVVERARMSLR
ncbi:MAG: peptidylprolyl isomerase [Balneolaceae bacterium]|nr:peptidylprolyl isomerase [Balneolaceae bacterium]MCH8549041.1 peptidylprolyl isomerase [Balneolaceae bacterium]